MHTSHSSCCINQPPGQQHTAAWSLCTAYKDAVDTCSKLQPIKRERTPSLVPPPSTPLTACESSQHCQICFEKHPPHPLPTVPTTPLTLTAPLTPQSLAMRDSPSRPHSPGGPTSVVAAGGHTARRSQPHPLWRCCHNPHNPPTPWQPHLTIAHWTQASQAGHTTSSFRPHTP